MGRESGNPGAQSAGVEAVFSTATRLLFGEALSGMDDYAEWLLRHLGEREEARSSFGGERIQFIRQYSFLDLIPRERIITFREMETEARGMKSGVSAESGPVKVLEEFPKIAYFNLDIQCGTNRDNFGTMGMEDTVNTYKSQDVFNSKGMGYSSYTKFTECSFGCYRAFYSKYCINCYNCVKCTGCFECDSCMDSSRAYFCHNCENVHDVMFCSNVKNLRYAIGNVVVGRGEYGRIKRMFLDYMLGELKSRKGLGLDIFNIGGK